MAKDFVGHAPMNAMMGWYEGAETKKDAVEYAKGFIQRRYTAQEASWYAVAPFMGGWLWEVHEGGPGRGYIGAAIDALTQNPDGKFWFPSADRAFQVMMRDGKPFGILLSKNESLPVMNSGQPSLIAATKMMPAVKKGTGVFLTGAALLGSAATFLVASMAFYAVSANPGPGLKAVDFSAMPHAQWPLVIDTHVEEIVSKLEMNGGKWNVEKRPHVIDGLKELREEGQKIMQRARDSVAPMPVEEEAPAAAGEQASSDAPASSDQPGAAGGSVPNPQGAAAPVQENMSPAERRRLAREQALRQMQQGAPAVAAPPAADAPTDTPDGGAQ